MNIRRVGVLGAGLMGSGIAEVCAKAGYETLVREVSEELVKKGMGRIEGSLGKAVEKGKLASPDRDAAWNRLSSTTRLEDLAECDLIVEAIVENLAVKKETYAALDRLCAPATIFCSNTSSLTITEMSAATKRADRFAGLHFFNPVPVMKLVEVVRTIATSDETAETVFAYAKSLGK
jgi:3-hydroxybutyryl-CoA dehydrogenase